MSAVDVLMLGDIDPAALEGLLARFGIELCHVADGTTIPGSFWGEPEAGIIGNRIYARPDTPLHSILHESSHIICMEEQRRDVLDRDAGGDDLEETAVCYLQVLLAGELDAVGSERLMSDMDAWGYSFRLGSTSSWFHEDAADASAWLVQEGLLGRCGALRYRCRTIPEKL